ncbi:MAG: hypothetical protein CL587_04005 [Alteromonadaceae bacterium]|nr:hypothetical protein [Alteromonadaceae bacterium]
MSKRVIFHIGPPKTGSSAIQHFLHSRRDTLSRLGVDYPKHDIDGNGISSGNARVICKVDEHGKLALDAQKLKAVINKFHASPEHQILLFSSESFFRIATDIVDALPDVEILCFIRNPIEYQLSIYNQSVKRHGNTKPFSAGRRLNLGQWQRLQSLQKRVSPSCFHCFAFKLPEDNGSIIQDLLGVLDIDMPADTGRGAINTSYSYPALELKRWLNQFPISAVQAELDAYLQSVSDGKSRYRLIDDNLLADYKTQLSSTASGFSSLLSEHEWEWLAGAHEKIEALPVRDQQENGSVVSDMLQQLKQDKPGLFRSLASVISSAESVEGDAQLRAQFRLKGIHYVLGAGKMLAAGTVKRLKDALSGRSALAGIKPVKGKLACVKRAEIIRQGPGSNPGIVKGGIRSAQEVPQFAAQFRCSNARSEDPVPQNVTDGEFLAAQPETHAVKKGEFFYGGPVFSNFGHFLAESVHRLAPLQQIRQSYGDMPVIFLPQRFRQKSFIKKAVLPPRFYEILEYLGVSKKHIVLPGNNIRTESLWVSPQQSFFRAREPVSAEYLSFLTAREKASGVAADPSLPKRLYVSRESFLMRGAFAGEGYLAAFMARQGFTIFKPESADIVTQLKYYKSAEEIVFAEGAALHVLELMGEIQAKITVLQRRNQTDVLFRPLLTARCQDVAFFGDLVELQSLYVPANQNSAAHGSALSFLDAEALAHFLAERLKCETLDVTALRQATAEDVVRYYRQYAAALATKPVTKQYLNRFEQKVNLMISEGKLDLPVNWKN